MNTTLIEKINTVLADTPLIYFARDAERAIGVEEHIQNYHICCIESSPLVGQLREKGVSIFCLEDELNEPIGIKSTSALLSSPKTIEWLKTIVNKGKFYALTFYPSKVVNYKLKNLNGVLLNNSYDYYYKLEDKISAAEFFQKAGVKTPRYKIESIDRLQYDEILIEFGKKFVVQLRRGHTGSGTFIIETLSDFLILQSEYSGNLVKITEFIDEAIWTINACITKKKISIGTLQYQITGISALTPSNTSTVGNDFSYSNNDSVLTNLVEKSLYRIGGELKKIGYRGIFGIDLIIKEKEVYILEVNARQTANIAFENQLRYEAGLTPLSLLHIAEFLGLESEVVEDIVKEVNGSQIFLRAPNADTVVAKSFESGVYVIEDNETGEIPFGSKSLKFIRGDYRIQNTDSNEILILFQSINSKKRKFDELCRMQFTEGIVEKGGTIPKWITEAMSSIRDKII